MSEPSSHAEFSELWRNVSKLSYSKTQDTKTEKQMPDTTTSPVCKDFQSPRHRGCSRYPGLANGDSPGDVEPSQDIFWDSTSPTQANTGLRNTRAVKISDIVNRIAPKDVKPERTESPLLQWIGDSAISCTPETRKPRLKKKSSRQSSVEDLMKLARQFDESMQQDKETSESLHTVNNDLNECANSSEVKLAQGSFHDSLKDLKSPSLSDQVEADLHTLFDCSTQSVWLSRGSAASTCSPEIRGQSVSAALPKEQQSELKSAAYPAEKMGSNGYSANNCDDFDDDWENDDLLNDSFVLAMTHEPHEQHDTDPNTTFQCETKTNTTHSIPVHKPNANSISAHEPLNRHCEPSCSVTSSETKRTLQELCPKLKTTNRNTFKLEPNPDLRAKMDNGVSKSSFTVIQPKPHMFDQKSKTTKRSTTSRPGKVTSDHSGASLGKDISDSLWDDRDDDALLYQVCDSVERVTNSQSLQASPSNCQEKQDIAVDRQRKTTQPVPINMTRPVSVGASANTQSPCAFVRSNSLPSASCETVNYQGWNIPMKGANKKSQMSQSFPTNLGTLRQCRDSSGTFQAGNANLDKKQHTVTARALHNSKTHHTAFKRNLSDSAATSTKVFVTSQMTGKCSAAEIERKKQEALARRRLRMQNATKP
ncbi:ewing's tumor-associated antigen 1 [Archocentrus centrarchus]|uniref:ewing's tumor-associated antigen 1 n=1 Tax=Archocentrus centrarchus TaxID=63155 RepID=UPI0011EA1854|nr:ewing's tumor-associated antigen 1 [Archocentrus centrarchus]